MFHLRFFYLPTTYLSKPRCHLATQFPFSIKFGVQSCYYIFCSIVAPKFCINIVLHALYYLLCKVWRRRWTPCQSSFESNWHFPNSLFHPHPPNYISFSHMFVICLFSSSPFSLSSFYHIYFFLHSLAAPASQIPLVCLICFNLAWYLSLSLLFLFSFCYILVIAFYFFLFVLINFIIWDFFCFYLIFYC